MTNRQARARAAASREWGKHNSGRIDVQIAFESAYQSKPSQADDLFGSNVRRAAQAEKDAKEIAEPVAATPAGTGRLNLRPIAERVEVRSCENGEHTMGDNQRCTRCGRSMLELFKRVTRPKRTLRKQFTSPANRERSAR